MQGAEQFITRFAGRRRPSRDHVKAVRFDLIANSFQQMQLPTVEQGAFWTHIVAAHPDPAIMDHASVQVAATSFVAQHRPPSAHHLARAQFLLSQTQCGIRLPQAIRNWSQQPDVVQRKRHRETGVLRHLGRRVAGQASQRHQATVGRGRGGGRGRGRGRGRGAGRGDEIAEPAESSEESSSETLSSQVSQASVMLREEAASPSSIPAAAVGQPSGLEGMS